MSQDAILEKKLIDCEAAAALLAARAADLKEYCHRTRAKMEGGNSPSARKGKPALDRKHLALIVAKRNARIKNTK